MNFTNWVTDRAGWCLYRDVVRAIAIGCPNAVRGTLLVLMAAGVLVCGERVRAQVLSPTPQCQASGSAVHCRGDLSAGVDIDERDNAEHSSLAVDNPDGDIRPVDGVEGVRFRSTGDVAIVSDTDAFAIITTGDGGDGLRAESTGGVVTVTHRGDIVTTGRTGDGIHAGSDGGAVTVSLTGNIDTAGEHGFGITARANHSGAVTVTHAGRINTTGKFSSGIIAHSQRDTVSVVQTGDIGTRGDRSEGLIAYSYGHDLVAVRQVGDISTDGAESEAIEAKSFGGGAVTVEQAGNVSTRGRNAAIVATSNGGVVTITQIGAVTSTGDSYSPGISAFSQGNAAVVVQQEGTVATTGDESDGILARSTGGPVALTQTGEITITGDLSSAIVAVSEGGAAVNVEQTGRIATAGRNGQGILARSDGGSASIVLSGGSIRSEQGSGVFFPAGTDNLLTVHNTVAVSGGASDIRGLSANETIINHGRLTTPGVVALGSGANVFINLAGATYDAGSSVLLGTGNLFTNAGNLSPGGADRVQATNLNGDFRQAQSGTFTVTVDAVTGRADRLDVSGAVTLDGGTVVVSGSALFDRPLTVMTAADGISGTFDAVTSALLIEAALTYDEHNVYLTLSAPRSGFCDLARTPNQVGVACFGLDSLPTSDAVVQAVTSLSAPAELRAAYDALSGEIHPSLKGVLIDDGGQRIAAINDRLHSRFSDPRTEASTAPFGTLSETIGGDTEFWITGYGAWSRMDATSNTARVGVVRRGVIFGIDRPAVAGWRLGFAAGYGHIGMTLGDRRSGGASNTRSLGVYGGTEADPWRLSFGALHNWHAIDTSRSASFGGLSQTLAANYSVRSWQVFAEAGVGMQLGGLLLEPYAGISLTSLDADPFAENGGSAGLAARPDEQDNTAATLGLRIFLPFGDTLQARAKVGWRHGFGSAVPSSVFTLADSSAFKVSGAPFARDTLISEFGFEARLSERATIASAFSGRYGSGTASYGFETRANLKF